MILQVRGLGEISRLKNRRGTFLIKDCFRGARFSGQLWILVTRWPLLKKRGTRAGQTSHVHRFEGKQSASVKMQTSWLCPYLAFGGRISIIEFERLIIQDRGVGLPPALPPNKHITAIKQNPPTYRGRFCAAFAFCPSLIKFNSGAAVEGKNCEGKK